MEKKSNEINLTAAQIVNSQHVQRLLTPVPVTYSGNDKVILGKCSRAAPLRSSCSKKLPVLSLDINVSRISRCHGIDL